MEKPFPIHDINVRIGAKSKDKTAALPLFYLQADAVRQRLDKACEIENASWSYDFEVFVTPEHLIASAVSTKAFSIKATIKVRKDNVEIARSSVGEETFDKVESTEVFKSAETDAFKRAANRFGVGGYLRSLKKIWFPLDKYERFEASEADIVKQVYDESGIVVDEIDFDEVIYEILLNELETKKDKLNRPCLFVDSNFCKEFEKKRGLKAGSWWSVMSVFGIPIRKYTYSEIVDVAKILIGNINDDNYESALVVSKAMKMAYQYPSHFGRQVIVQQQDEKDKQ